MIGNRFTKSFRFSTLLLVLVLFVSIAGSVIAQGPDQPTVTDVTSKSVGTIYGVNILWLLVAGILVFFMQAGFALVETGFTRNKLVAHTMMMNRMLFCVSAIRYGLPGSAFQFSNVNFTFLTVNRLDSRNFSPITPGNWSGLLDQPSK